MRAFSSRPFCLCDGRQMSLGDLPAAARYMTRCSYASCINGRLRHRPLAREATTPSPATTASKGSSSHAMIAAILGGSSAVRRAGKERAMVRETAYRSILLSVCLLLGLTGLGNTQSGTRRPPETRGVTLGPNTPPGSPVERRVALVIGNGQYQYVTRLDNPTNDARLIAETLTSVGFTLIGGKAQLDLDKTGFDRLVQEFGKVIQNAGVALFYYAGHGLQVRGANYLVPVSANPTREADVDFQLLNVDLVLRQMEGAGTRLNFLILDACRNNPFAGRGLRAAGGGLAQMQAPEGTLISYATQPGNVAQDGTDGHSPYTLALANAVRKPGLDLFAVFNETELEVKQRTGGAQQPWVSSSPISGQFYFNQFYFIGV